MPVNELVIIKLIKKNQEEPDNTNKPVFVVLDRLIRNFSEAGTQGWRRGYYVYPSTMGLKIKELVLKLNQPEVLRKSQN